MNKDQGNPELGSPLIRWRDRQPGGDGPEDRAAEIVRGALIPGEPDGLHLARIEQNLRVPEGRRGRSVLVSRLVFAGVLLLAGIAAAKAYDYARTAGWFGWSLSAQVAPAAPVRPKAAKRGGRAPASPPGSKSAETIPDVPAQTADSPVVDAPVHVQPALATPARSQPHPPRKVAVVDPVWPGRGAISDERRALEPVTQPGPQALDVPQAASQPAAQEAKPQVAAPLSGPSEEMGALDEAIGLLRRHHNPAAALPILDGYLGRYPQGVLNREARLARVDALLMLERTQEALVALEELPLDNGRRSAELLVVRGELRARQDCARAESDFTTALSRSPDAVLLERILYGRGVCRAKLGNQSGAADDLHRYIERFPSGAYAGQVRRWLQTIRQSSEKGG